MKLKIKPMVWIRSLAASASIVTMCISPLALGAEAQKQKQAVNDYLKATGWGANKQMTMMEFWQKVRHTYPDAIRNDVDRWMVLNRNQLMPKVDVSTYKDRNGQEQLRISLVKDGEVVTLTNTGDDDKNVKINNVTIAKSEIFDHLALMKKLAAQDPSIKKSLAKKGSRIQRNATILTAKEYVKLSDRQKAEYLYRLRLATESAQKVFGTFYGQQALNELNSKNQWAFEFLFGEPAQATPASLTGKPCVIAGWMGIYGENQSCGGKTKGANNLETQMFEKEAGCPNKGVACNPMVYGFSSGGAAHCVARADVKYATEKCNGLAPLQDSDPLKEAKNKKAIIESYLAVVKKQKIDLQLDKDGKISQEQYDQIKSYFNDLQAYIDTAEGECEAGELAVTKKFRPDQVSACKALLVRAFSLDKFQIQPVPKNDPPTPLDNQAADCNLSKPNSDPNPNGKGCVCPVGITREEPRPGIPEKKEGEVIGAKEAPKACVPLVAAEQEKEDKDGLIAGAKGSPIKGKVVESCTFFCGNTDWKGPAVVVALIALFALMVKKTKSVFTPPVVNNPAAVDPGATATPKPTTPILPTAPECKSPSMWVGGVCTAPQLPTIPTAPTVKSEGGNTPDTVQGVGGNR